MALIEGITETLCTSYFSASDIKDSLKNEIIKCFPGNISTKKKLCAFFTQKIIFISIKLLYISKLEMKI